MGKDTRLQGDGIVPRNYLCRDQQVKLTALLIRRKSPHVRIDNSPPLETQAQERELNPEPGFPQAARPMDRGTARPHFSGVKPPQTDAEDDGPPSKTD
ncbi:hypothetical protein DSO57_1030396 [Entomophthora muscae]|uniref:Uncharacterized protein n=1 Tax=Entomophthora muscae TaxID=34485 RepID=A0ACC2RFP5_9FUNG|nr:hypothetical protein DSO57_1030396 [Entomophthora muscae]